MPRPTILSSGSFSWWMWGNLPPIAKSQGNREKRPPRRPELRVKNAEKLPLRIKMKNVGIIQDETYLKMGEVHVGI